ncbi:FAD:protein FMN transferase [Jatrophihabitans endophyticus]|uniref:FAD:protein FMN transferase n=1 Tax=Jatrophihabitans endophyticus TaxID=1206085 RepID=UPI0019F82791|nr:FAD:protein FMN transferase [Jatrophihabitans endophyticus]MBE7188237.1 FAD:protein FMN transferase [Jatrophihabitans endophyticus]
MSAAYDTEAWTCHMRLVVTDPAALPRAAADLETLLARVDRAASAFRPDSALAFANRSAGRPVPVPRLLVDLVDAALAAAGESDGAVDPTLGLALRRLGRGHHTDERDCAEPAAGRWRSVRVHREAGLITVPRGTALDLGATAKAWTADHAARSLAARYGTSVLVELGGDVAVAGPTRAWRLRVAEREGGPGQLVTLHAGGLATSTTTVRTGLLDGEPAHHLVDPATGRPTSGPWRTVSVAAESAFAANLAATAAIVKGEDAPAWLAGRRVAARLVAQDGSVSTLGDWPAPHVATGRAA